MRFSCFMLFKMVNKYFKVRKMIQIHTGRGIWAFKRVLGCDGNENE